MIAYMVNLVFVTFMSSCAMLTSRHIPNNKLNELGYNKPETILSFVVFLSLFFVSGLRWRVGTDYWTYERIFTNAQTYTLDDLLEKNPEFLRTLIDWGLGVTFNNPQITFAFYSFLICFLIIKSLESYSNNYAFSVILYILTMEYYYSFNGIAQWVAAAIILLGYKHIVRREFKKYLIYVLLATGFHSTSLIALVFYFFVTREFFSKRNLILIISSIASTYFFHSFLSSLFLFLDHTQYGEEYSTWFVTQDRGANSLRFLVALVPVIIGSIYYKKLSAYRSDFNILMNFSLINCLIMLLATQNVIFARLSFYFSIYNVFIIPLFIKLFDKKGALFMFYVILLLYFAYMILLLPFDSRLLPYNTIFDIPDVKSN